jgi:hypothetical protein
MHSATREMPFVPQPHPESAGADLANMLNYYPMLEHTDLVSPRDRTQQSESWGVTVFTADGQEQIVDAPAGSLIRYTDEKSKYTSYSFINTDGERMLLDPTSEYYPIEVAGRITRVEAFCKANNYAYEAPPLNMRAPEALHPAAAAANRRGAHTGESRLKRWAKKIGAFFVRDMLTEEAPPEYTRGEPALAPVRIDQTKSLREQAAQLAPAIPQDIVASLTLTPKAPSTELVGPLPKEYDSSNEAQRLTLLKAMGFSNFTDFALEANRDHKTRQHYIRLLGEIRRSTIKPILGDAERGNPSASAALSSLNGAHDRLLFLLGGGGTKEYLDYGAQ